MSFPLRRKAVPLTTAALVASTLLLAVPAAHAGPTPEQQCQAAKHKVAGKYYACLNKASAKYATTGDATNYSAALDRCNAKYDLGWQKQDDRATKVGTTCYDGGTTDGDFRSFIASNWSTVAAGLAGAPLSVCGNGTVEAPEACDGAALGGATCVTQGFAGGTLRCASGCTLDTSGCYATRFVDNGDGTVTDNQTGLEWEQKTTAVGSGTNDGDDHDVDNTYSYSQFIETIGGIGFLDFLNGLSLDGTTMVNCFAGHCDWRLPTIAELQTILLAPYPCGTTPCIDPIFGPTAASVYWSSTTYVTYPNYAWVVGFDDGGLYGDVKSGTAYVRAVRGGS